LRARFRPSPGARHEQGGGLSTGGACARIYFRIAHRLRHWAIFTYHCRGEATPRSRVNACTTARWAGGCSQDPSHSVRLRFPECRGVSADRRVCDTRIAAAATDSSTGAADPAALDAARPTKAYASDELADHARVPPGAGPAACALRSDTGAR